MRIIKKFSDFIVEQKRGGFGQPTKTETETKTKTVVNQGSGNGNSGGSGKDTETKSETPVVNPTAPDSAVMTKLLTIPNSRGAIMSNSNEEKPTVHNGVSLDVKGTGRNYNFRSTPKSLVVYVNDGSGKIAYSGTWEMTDTEITTKSTDGKIIEVIGFDGKLAVDPATKQPKSNLPSNETVADKQKGVAQTVAAAIKANSGDFKDSNETVVYNAIEAALYWIVKNNLPADQAREFLATTFSDDAVHTVTQMEVGSWAGFLLYPGLGPANALMKNIQKWTIEWQPENDDDTKYLADKVKTGSALFSYEPSGDDAKKWAETIWNIIDDSWVSTDEETNAVLAILALTQKGLLNVDAAWKDLQTLGIIDTNLSIEGAISDEIDAADTAELVKRFAAAIRGKVSDGAKKLIELS